MITQILFLVMLNILFIFDLFHLIYYLFGKTNIYLVKVHQCPKISLDQPRQGEVNGAGVISFHRIKGKTPVWNDLNP